jgi:hypothetical protein
MRQRARSRGTDSCDDWIVSQSHLTDSPASLPGKVKVSTNFWYIVQYHIVPCVDELLLCLHPSKNRGIFCQTLWRSLSMDWAPMPNA